MKEIKSFVLYKDFDERLKELDNEEKGKLFTAIFNYHNNKEYLTDNRIVNYIVNSLIPQFKKDEEKWLKEKEKRSIAGKKGGRPKKSQSIIKEKPKINKEPKIKKDEIYFEDEKVNNIFLEFLNMRKKMKAVNNERSINMLIKKLEEFDNETKLKMIENSIINSWKSIYPLKKDKIEESNKYIEPVWEEKKEEEVDLVEMKEILKKI